jgi:hypothetical protein
VQTGAGTVIESIRGTAIVSPAILYEAGINLFLVKPVDSRFLETVLSLESETLAEQP